ncbi:MAG: polysaccharide deacetylase family protein [Thiohalocapsa sp.]|uniref:polysaccharide deacetylase family protein n=1 Tax=Thiohalocapsa sp. TaxID=2497641 RepID=UPI0025E829F7|nr:polysaccharide deacetylase family protein [Thiohalocapsa sp.]MCG6941384.1 polysaccharide deacetylase family protein [Thiohalocapsa sp.]
MVSSNANQDISTGIDMQRPLKYHLILLAAATCMLAGALAWSETPTGSKAYITFSFDDAPITVYNNAAPLIAKYKFPATLFVITGLVARPGEQSWYMNWDQIHDLYQQGWEIGSHSHTHAYLTQISDAALAKEVDESFKTLTAQHLNPEVFATPYGDYNAKVVAAIGKRFSMHRRTWGEQLELEGFNDANAPKWMDMASHCVESGESVADVTGRIDRAVAAKKWLVLCFHNIVKGAPANDWEYRDTDLDKIFGHVASVDGLTVVDFGEMRGIADYPH